MSNAKLISKSGFLSLMSTQILDNAKRGSGASGSALLASKGILNIVLYLINMKISIFIFTERFMWRLPSCCNTLKTLNI